MAVQPLSQPSFERRIPLRLLAYWEKLRNGRSMPAERDINADDIRDVWDSCFLMQVKDVQLLHYHYDYVGHDIVRAYCGELNDKEAPVVPHPGMIDGYRTVIQTGKPLIENGEFTNTQNQTVKYRQCLLPLGEGDQVQAIFGALHLRIFPA